MNPRLRSLLFVLVAALAITGAAFADHHASGDKAPAPQKPADAYPLKTCVVSGEELGSMGDSFEYVHKEAGKPDRRVVLCCKMCLGKFKKDPAPYLKQIDDAQAAAKKS